MKIIEHKKNIKTPIDKNKTAFTVEVYSKDCSKCKYFITQPINHPSGKCHLNNLFTGVGYTCDGFNGY